MRKKVFNMAITSAESILKNLEVNGINYLFANPGCDFAPVIETDAENSFEGAIPACAGTVHENLRVTMAHGYYLVTENARPSSTSRLARINATSRRRHPHDRQPVSARDFEFVMNHCHHGTWNHS